MKLQDGVLALGMTIFATGLGKEALDLKVSETVYDTADSKTQHAIDTKTSDYDPATMALGAVVALSSLLIRPTKEIKMTASAQPEMQ